MKGAMTGICKNDLRTQIACTHIHRLPEKAKRGGDDGVLCIAFGRVETREELRSNRKEVMAAASTKSMQHSNHEYPAL
jgi:hypothetical protein